MQQELSHVQNDESEDFCSNYDFDFSDCNFSELDCPITAKEIREVVQNLKRNKSFSGDQLLNEYFIESLDI